jgi:hypothetical protein
VRANHALHGLFFLISFGVSYATEQPELRPALVYPGPRSLANLIDTKSLMKQGQGNAMVMFTCVVSPTAGTARYYTRVYGGTPGSEALTKEVLGKIDRATFRPAIYHHTPQTAIVNGTVVFVVAQGKPRLAGYLNQEMDDLTRGNDFGAPQLLFLSGTKFTGFHYPAKAGGGPGTVAIRMNIDANGKILGTKLLYEHPQGMDFGAQAMMEVRDATFLPGYRNGKPVSCSFTLPILFRGMGPAKWKTG